jgi:hypothetical protein
MEPMASELRDWGIDPADFKGRPEDTRLALQKAKREHGPERGHTHYNNLPDAALTDAFHYTLFPNFAVSVWADGFHFLRARPHASGDPALPLHDSASVASLLGLLRSDSMQQSLAALESHRGENAQPGSSELNLAALVRAASSTDMASGSVATSHNGMPPPLFTPWAGRNAAAPRAANSNLPGAPSIDDLYELQAFAGSFKESPSVTSLIDLVRSR